METNKSATVVHTVRWGNRRQVAVSDQLVADSHLQQQLMSVVAASDDKDSLIESTLAVLRATLSVPALACLASDSRDSVDVDLLNQTLPPGAAQRISVWRADAVTNKAAGIHAMSGAHQWRVLMVPLVGENGDGRVLAAAVREQSIDQANLLSALQLASASLAFWEETKQKQLAQVESRQSAALIELLAKFDECGSLSKACYCLANEAKEFLGCQRVAVGVISKNQHHCDLVAVSGLSGFDKRSELTREIEATLTESMLRDRITVASSEQPSEAGTLAHQRLQAALNTKTLITCPLTNQSGNAIGAWMLVDDSSPSESAVQFLRVSKGVLGAKLSSLRKTARSWWMRPLSAVASLARSRKLVLSTLVAVLLFGLMMVPMRYRIGCDIQLEPVSRRFVASPYDGTLQESMVKAGDLVSAGQVLARMDPRELRWELSGLDADYRSEKKSRDAASARDEVALAQQHDLEMQRLQVKMQLITHRLENLEIKSPIDGIVIAGDLKKSEGAPLTIGQAIFEIGPLDQMSVEVAIPERDILYVEDGMQVELRLDAAQGQTETATIARVFPRAEIRDAESVYIAEVTLPNTDGRLRPGMKGTAKIVSETHTLGWILFHKAWESLAMMVGC